MPHLYICNKIHKNFPTLSTQRKTIKKRNYNPYIYEMQCNIFDIYYLMKPNMKKSCIYIYICRKFSMYTLHSGAKLPNAFIVSIHKNAMRKCQRNTYYIYTCKYEKKN